jgi:hypothetical protein
MKDSTQLSITIVILAMVSIVTAGIVRGVEKAHTEPKYTDAEAQVMVECEQGNVYGGTTINFTWKDNGFECKSTRND